MRMQTVFTRYLPAALPLHPGLGSDSTTPNTAGPGGSPLGPSTLRDNMISAGVVTQTGAFVNKVAVSMKVVAGGPSPDLPAQMWFWDTATERWYFLEAAKNLSTDKIVVFLAPSLVEKRATQPNVNNPTAGGFDALLVVQNPGGPPPAGTYTFGMAPSLSD